MALPNSPRRTGQTASNLLVVVCRSRVDPPGCPQPADWPGCDAEQLSTGRDRQQPRHPICRAADPLLRRPTTLLKETSVHPETFRLPHSGLTVPHTGYAVTSYKELQTPDGVAFT